MKRHDNRAILAFFVAGATLFATGAGPARAQGILYLDNSNDTVEMEGQTVLGTAGTLEARVLFRDDESCGIPGRRLYWEMTPGFENKTFMFVPQSDCSSASLAGQMFPTGGGSSLVATITTRAECWDHIAFVYDGAEQRWYLNGVLVVSRSASGSVGSGVAKGHIGAMDFGSGFRPAFVGYLDFLRISSISRYSGSTFVPPVSDPAPDADTLLLYNFNDAPGSTTVTDESGNNRTGHFGIGFPGATSPELMTSLPPDIVVCAPCEADLDGDGDVDIDDFAVFANCMDGPGLPVALGCERTDLDGDGDADLADFAAFQVVFACP